MVKTWMESRVEGLEKELLDTRSPVSSWKSFKDEVLQRFKPSQESDGSEAPMVLKQEEIVMKYREQFKILSTLMVDALGKLIIGFFSNNLQVRHQGEVRMTRVSNLKQLVDLAHKVEERN
ncbi:1-phosphatidylinositol-3-phosphate 5-kinase [Senna tora]|uniref:1-phosphatidylinositol-3-phosphate 5-kinase n=1 Tax=Senna tora TaxID=362788 RepID=A0A834WQ01_9FABA|nr:1-phosphatidylinositol-3-phosphate 5-kinase [Senna tora]